jgi:hypothetical protein
MDLPVVARRTCTCVKRYCRHHQRLRATWLPVIARGDGRCWRCSQPIAPDQPWDLGHADDDPNVYRGPECTDCNRSTSTRRKNERRWEL